MNPSTFNSYIQSTLDAEAIPCRDALVIRVTREKLLPLITQLKENPNTQCTQLTYLCGVDYPEREERFEVVYHLLSMTMNARVRIITTTDEHTAIPSLTSLFPSASWYEREVWDMYGVIFENHPDPRRILTDYGFEGHPLRKDFPLTGYSEVRYNMETQKVAYEPVMLEQAYRSFDFLSPWEGMVHPKGKI